MINKNAKIIFDKKTKYQQVTIAQVPEFGRCLFLDQDIQSTESDQESYHTYLVDHAFKLNPDIKSALILGGGEGATAKKLLLYSNIKKVVMVDIDQELIEICIEYLPDWSKGAFTDPKLSVYYQDAGKFLKESSEEFDLILWDLTDPCRYEDKTKTPSVKLYTPKMFKLIREHLTTSGILSMEYTPHNQKLIESLLYSWRPEPQRNLFIPSFNENWIFKLYKP